MSRIRAKILRLPGPLLKLPCLLRFVFSPEIGEAHGVGTREKLRLISAFRRNAREVETLSSLVEHVEMASELLRTPPTVPGDVVECGCYMGGCSVNLSLVCELVGRRLVICDSFQGLPRIPTDDEGYVAPHHGQPLVYEEGQFAASLDAVRENLSRWGALGVCDFKVGYFEETMSELDRPVAMAFLDVDLVASLRPCLEAIWPRLPDGGRVYVHEAEDLNLAATFFDRGWWRETLGVNPPGLVGAGTGLPLVPLEGSDLGFAERRLDVERASG